MAFLTELVVSFRTTVNEVATLLTVRLGVGRACGPGMVNLMC